MMTVIKAVASWLASVADWFPVAVQPGVYAVLLILLIWAAVHARRPAYNALLRLSCLAADFLVGLLLLPEFAFTRAQRANGYIPGPVTLAGGRAAERVLDLAAGVYATHPAVRIRKRPPIVLIVLLLVASGVDYWLLHRAPPNSASRGAHNIWNAWVQYRNWTQAR